MKYLALILFTAQLLDASLVFNDNFVFKSVSLNFGSEIFPNITAEITSNINDSFSKIIISERPIPLNLDASLQTLLAPLPAAVLIINPSSYQAGTERLWIDCSKCFANAGIPLFAIDRANGLMIVQMLQNGSLPSLATITYDPNPWEITAKSGLWIAAQVIIASMSITLVVLVIINLVSFVRFQGYVDFSIAQTSLLILLAAGVGEIICWIADPWFSRQFFPFNFYALFVQIPSALITIAVITVNVYWFELLTAENIRVSKFTNKFGLPFLIFAICYVVFALIVSITRTFAPQSAALSLFPLIVSSIIFLFFSAFYWFTGIKLIQHLKAKKMQRMKKVTGITITSGIILVLRVILAWVSGVGGLLNSAVGFFVIAFLTELLALSLAILLTLSFQPRNKKFASVRSITNSAASSASST